MHSTPSAPTPSTYTNAAQGSYSPSNRTTPTLFAALDALAWAEVPIAARDIDTGHGRVTTRTIQVLPAPTDLPFPHVNQVWLVERYTTDLAGTPLSAVAALGVTNLPAQPGTPQRLATLIRQHGGIESLHWLRDTLYREDNSTIHTRSGPRVMAALRNLAIGAIRLTGRRDITEATRSAGRNMDPLQDPQAHRMILKRPWRQPLRPP
jgi:hypothetical protein